MVAGLGRSSRGDLKLQQHLRAKLTDLQKAEKGFSQNLKL